MDSNSPEVSNFTPINLPDFQPATAQKQSKFHPANIALFATFCVFVLSLAYWIQTNQLTSQTQAQQTQPSSVETAPQVQLSPTPRVMFPKSYKKEDIPQTIYAGTEVVNAPAGMDKGEYIKDRVTRYYMYKDILSENSINLPSASQPASFNEIETGLTALETILKEKLVSTSEFAFVHARFAGQDEEDLLKSKFGALDEKAQSIIKKYQQLFVASSYTPQQIIEVANKDEELLLLNNKKENQYLVDYSSLDNLFSEDKGFNDFLFTQKVRQLSDIYTLRDSKETPVGYIIVYPAALNVKKISSINKELEQRISFFSY